MDSQIESNKTARGYGHVNVLPRKCAPLGRSSPPDFSLALREKILQVTGWGDELRRIYGAMKDTNDPPMVLISGKVDSGSLLLAETLRAPVELENGYFLRARFDHLKLQIPFEALVAAFTELTLMVVDRGQEEVSRIRNAIRMALGEEPLVLPRMIPSLEKILGPTEDHKPFLASQGMARRFVHELRMFICAMCSISKPVVLLLENLHWADDCTLDLLGSLRDDENLRKLILVGTCDTSDLSATSYISAVLRRIEDAAGSSIVNIECRDLSKSVLAAVSKNLISPDSDRTNEEVCSLIHLKTNGSFVALDFLAKWMVDKCWVVYNKVTNTWMCNFAAVARLMKGCSVSDMLLLNLSKLPRHQLHQLKLLACLGLVIEHEVVQCVLKTGEDCCGDVMRLSYVVDCNHGLMFKSTMVRQLIYESISQEERTSLHRTAGRSLLQHLDDEQLDINLFRALSQLYLCRPLETKDCEKTGVASLCLRAAQKAAKLSCFRTSSLYLEFALETLGSLCWGESYCTSLAVHNALAEMSLWNRNYDRMNEMVEIVLSNATSSEHKIPAYATRVYHLGAVGKQKEAVETGLRAMCLAGKPFPEKFFRLRLMQDFFQVARRLSRKSDEQLLRLPTMEDENKLACMRILHLMMAYVFQAGHNSEWASLIVLQQMKLTLTYGISAFAPTAFVAYGVLHVHVCKDWPGGYRYGTLALKLLEKYRCIDYVPRVYFAFYTHLSPLKNHIQCSIQPLKFATEIGVQTGDFESAGACAICCTFAMFEASTPLEDVIRHFEEYKGYLVSNGQKAVVDTLLPIMEAIYRYTGRSPDPIASKGVLVDYDEAQKQASEKGLKQICAMIRVVRSKVAFYFNEYETALAFMATESDLKTFNSASICVQNKFARGLIIIAAARMGKWKKGGLRRYLRRTCKLLNRYAVLCPANFLDKTLLFEAEVESLLGRNDLASTKYKCAISSAATNKYLFYHALANELCARHFVRIGLLETARAHYQEACTSYREWGGKAKLSRLQDEVRLIFQGKHL